MIGWINGNPVHIWTTGSRAGVIVNCCGIGYEVQLLKRNLNSINIAEDLILWIHQVFRDDGSTLFGFKEELDRNLFRKLIGVNGVGPQLAISLLEQNESNELIQAILGKDIQKLMKSSGVGKRLGERLVIELQNKLNEFDPSSLEDTDAATLDHQSLGLTSELFDELQSTLINLEYGEEEIDQALKAIRSNSGNTKKTNDSSIENLLKESLMFLSQ